MFEADWEVAEAFRHHTTELDVRRGERFREVFPELADFIEPHPFVGYLNRGFAKRKFGRLDEALMDFDRAVRAIAVCNPPDDLERQAMLARSSAVLPQVHAKRDALRPA